jgi:lipopolysaccharide export system protein LptA
MNVRMIYLLVLVCCLALAQAVQAGSVPVNIQADSMRYSPSGKEVTFEGNVRVIRLDVTIDAAKITIHLAGNVKSEPGGVAAMDPGSISRIVAGGGVRINYQGKRGSCATAVYHVPEGLLVMEGAPVLEDGKNSIKGHKIKFYLKENRSEVVSGEGQRVNATFHAPESIKVPGQ